MKSLKVFHQKTIFQVRYKAHLKYYTAAFSVASRFEEEGFPLWETDGHSVILRDPKRQCSIAVAAGSFSYDQDVGDEELAQKNIKMLLDKLPEALAVNSYDRIGYRKQVLVPLDMQFQDLVKILKVKLFSEEESFAKTLPGQIDTLGIRMHFSDNDYKFNFLLLPYVRREGHELDPLLNAPHLSEEIRGEISKKILSQYPEVALKLDIDVYREAENISMANAVAFVEGARNKVTSIVDDWKTYLFATTLGGQKK